MKRLLLLLLLALPLAADEPITVIPPGPTTLTPVTLRLNLLCYPITGHQFLGGTAGTLIRIELTSQQGTCPSPSSAPPYDINLGRLPAGEIVVEVYLNNFVFKRTFLVRNATPAVGGIEVHPFAVPTNPNGLKMRLTAPVQCAAANNCANVQVRIGTTILTGSQLHAASDGAIWFDAPAHAKGFMTVVVSTDTHTYTGRNDFYYYDPAEPPDMTLWERVLFPVLFDSRGQNGSQWVSEAAISNPTRWYVENYNRVDAQPCIDFGCTQLLAPGQFFEFGGAGYPHGIALLVPRGESERLAYSLRVRDVARQAEGFGTEVPVVRDSKLVRDADLTLLDVPIDPLYRTKVRVYIFHNDDHGANVRVQNGMKFSSIPLTLTRTCEGNACAATPWYGEVDLAPGAAGERVNLYVHTDGVGSLMWAFASVTNNETQQVTIVTPDGIGGSPEVQ